MADIRIRFIHVSRETKRNGRGGREIIVWMLRHLYFCWFFFAFEKNVCVNCVCIYSDTPIGSFVDETVNDIEMLFV